MKVKLIAFDLDGTVLREDKTFGIRTAQALEAAAKKGIEIVPATGRLYKGMPEEIRRLPFIHYVIAVNGSQIYDVQKKEVLYRAELTKDEVQQVFRQIQGVPAICGCYQNDRGWMSQSDYDKIDSYALMPQLSRMMKDLYQPVENLEEMLLKSEHRVQKLMLFFADLEARKRTLKNMLESLSNLAVSSSIPNNIEVNTRKANKGQALVHLCNHLGIDAGESIAFGDGTNDLTMIRAAGTGVAMGNACQDLLQEADKVARSNEEDGVADYLERYVL